MPQLHIDCAPRMTQRPVAAGVLPPGQIIAVDIGASGGIESHWAALGGAVRRIGFEPDGDECARLNRTAAANVRYFPYALAGTTGPRTFHLRGFRAGCSLVPLPDRAELLRFFPEDFVARLADDEQPIAIDAVSFDDFLARVARSSAPSSAPASRSGSTRSQVGSVRSGRWTASYRALASGSSTSTSGATVASICLSPT